MRSFVLALLAGVPRIALPQEALTETTGFGDDPGNLRMFRFIPGPDLTEQRALVVVLHGCGQSAQDIADLTGWNKLAAIHDFIVIYPQQRFRNNPNHCFNWFETKDTGHGKGEVRSIHEMIRHAVDHWNVDTARIHAVGYSAGAAMAVSLLAAYPGVFNGGASFAGAAYQLARTPREGLKALVGKVATTPGELCQRVLDQCPEHQGPFPRLVIFQGLEDKVVRPRNAHLLFEQWKCLRPGTLSCGEDDTISPLAELRRTRCTDMTGDERIVLYEMAGLGHKIVVDPGDRADQGGKAGSFSVNKEFHSTHRIALDLKIISHP